MGCVYKATNTVNGKIYIGKTIRPLKVRIQGHITNSKKGMGYFQRAIRKYGEESFVWEEIYQSNNEKELFHKEKEYISLYESNKKGVGYNLTIGGEGASVGILGSSILRKLYYEYVNLEDSVKRIGATLDIIFANNIELESFDKKGTINFYRYLPMAYTKGMEILAKMERVLNANIDDNKRYYISGYYDKIIEAAS